MKKILLDEKALTEEFGKLLVAASGIRMPPGGFGPPGGFRPSAA